MRVDPRQLQAATADMAPEDQQVMTDSFDPNGEPLDGPNAFVHTHDPMQDDAGASGMGSTALVRAPQTSASYAYDDPASDQSPDEIRRAAITGLYGADCPLLEEVPSKEGWGKWPEALWERHRAGKRRRNHLSQRNRLFRSGAQWVSATKSGPWREPPKPPNAARFVYNMIGPALDQRVQIVADQRPGFRTRPTTQDPEDTKKAEAQQVGLEYQFDQQKMPGIIRETEYWAGTDGSSYWMVYWDAEAGPWHTEDPAYTPQPGPDGEQPGGAVMAQPQQPDQMDPPQEAPGAKYPLGDVRTRVFKADQIAVSANATATQKPAYWIIRETIPYAEAISIYGEAAVKAGVNHSASNTDMFDVGGTNRLGFELPGLGELHQEQETIDRYIVFCEPSEYLPQGLTVIALACYPIWVGPLVFGVVPMVRITDGSTDPSFFPCPIMESWLDHQILVNAVISKWVESVRTNAGGRFIIKKNAVSTETLIGGLLSAIETRGSGPISESIQAVQPFSVGGDAKELLTLAKAAFEEASGWNAASRGNFSSDASGRAILAARESLERIFAEPVNAMASALVEWAKIVLHAMKWGYDIPRTVGVTGKIRSDLARPLQSADFDGVSDVEIDPETLMPMPRALRLFLLDQMFERGVITPQEYRRRLPFAYTRDLDTPDEGHKARAERIADALVQGRPAPPILWIDNEAIHQDVLERRILLNDDLDPMVSQIAMQRWTDLANQAAMKMAPPIGAPQGAPQPGKSGTPMDPHKQPMLSTNPGMASAPAAQMTGFQDERNAQALKDRTVPY